jgi:dTDP-4-amino-4,6-dideoxygalactose transaminase
MNQRIWLSSPHMSGNEMKYIREAFDRNYVAPVGENIEALEKALCEHLGVSHAVATNTGTAALHLALINLGVGQGDEVIVSDLTFCASVNPILYQGATPVFVDSEPVTGNMDPVLLEEAIRGRINKGQKPRALVLVHIYGMPARVDEILDVTRRYDIPLIEDAAEALGSQYKGKYLGGLGDMGILSFNGNKIITTSGGGALVTNNKDHARRALHLATQARDDAPHYQHTEVGYNYRMSNILAGIGRGQMEVLEERVDQRRRVYQYYRQALGDLPGLTFPQEPEHAKSNRWLTTVLVESREAGVNRETLRLALESQNIESRPLWKPMHLQPAYQKHPSCLNGTGEELFRKGLCLPSGSNMSQDDIERVIGEIRKNFSSQ